MTVFEELFQSTFKILWTPDFSSVIKPSYNDEFNELALFVS